jgi:hypothetical protein
VVENIQGASQAAQSGAGLAKVPRQLYVTPVVLLIPSITDWFRTPPGKFGIMQCAFESPAVTVAPEALGGADEVVTVGCGTVAVGVLVAVPGELSVVGDGVADAAADGDGRSVGDADAAADGELDGDADAESDGDAEPDDCRSSDEDGGEDPRMVGDRLVATVQRKLTEPVAPAGDVPVTVTSYVPDAFAAMVPVISPLELIDKPGGRFDAENCGACPSAALSDVTCNWIALPTAFCWLPGSSSRTAAWRK